MIGNIALGPTVPGSTTVRCRSSTVRYERTERTEEASADINK